MWKISFSGNAGKMRYFYVGNRIEFSKEIGERKYKIYPLRGLRLLEEGLRRSYDHSDTMSYLMNKEV